MTNKSTKRALVSSVMALFLCFAMLLGTTYAWFTDVAVSEGNKITAGTLDVELYQWTNADTATAISESKAPVFDADILWEPGYTSVVYLSIKNNGTLALKYKVAIEVTSASTHNLAEVMEYDFTPSTTAKYGYVNSWSGNGTEFANKLGTNEITAEDTVLNPGEENFFALSIHMLEEAENKYMGEDITFDIRVIAGQATVEENSFGDKTYDAFASYPGEGFAPPFAANQSAVTVNVVGDDGNKVASAMIPRGAIENPEESSVDVKVKKINYNGNISVETGLEKASFDVNVIGLKENNTELVKVSLRVPAGLDPDTVKLYHYDTAIDSSYNPNTGYVTFETATFSPFTVVYDAESVYVAPEVPVLPDDVAKTPVATVTYESQYVNVDLPWESYGSWSPTAGLDSKLEAAFTFACPDYDAASEDYKAVIDAYRYWNCDFYVSLDKALGENQLFLGGNYGSFGWVGFHNGDLTLEANTEIGLLEGVTTNPWTYDDVENYVGTFTCGVGDVGDALNGATFTVKLRLTNPANEAEFYDVNVVTYTFGGSYTIK